MAGTVGAVSSNRAVADAVIYPHVLLDVFLPTLRAQRDHAGDHHQPERRQLFDRLINGLGEDTA